MVVEGLLYTKEHEWVKVDGDKATVGITDYAQDQLGELTFVELPELGGQVQQKGELAVVESSKAASDVYSPVTGKVVEANSELEGRPELINEDCYNNGWLCKLQVTDTAPLAKLMDAKAYEQYLEGLGQ